MMQNSICKRALRMLDHAGIVLTEQEILKMEVADFGLGEVELQGLELIVYVNSDRHCADVFIDPRIKRLADT